MFLHDEGDFIINMKSANDKNLVLQSGPHLFGDKTVILKPWCAKFHFHAEVLRVGEIT